MTVEFSSVLCSCLDTIIEHCCHPIKTFVATFTTSQHVLHDNFYHPSELTKCVSSGLWLMNYIVKPPVPIMYSYTVTVVFHCCLRCMEMIGWNYVALSYFDEWLQDQLLVFDWLAQATDLCLPMSGHPWTAQCFKSERSLHNFSQYMGNSHWWRIIKILKLMLRLC